MLRVLPGAWTTTKPLGGRFDSAGLSLRQVLQTLFFSSAVQSSFVAQSCGIPAPGSEFCFGTHSSSAWNIPLVTMGGWDSPSRLFTAQQPVSDPGANGEQG